MKRPLEAFYSFRRRDILAIALVLITAAAVFARFYFKEAGDTAEIYLDGRLVKTMPLSMDAVYEVNGEYTNVIEVSNGRVRVAQSDCPGGDCVHTGYIERGVIICAPNALEVRVGSGDVDSVAY